MLLGCCNALGLEAATSEFVTHPVMRFASLQASGSILSTVAYLHVPSQGLLCIASIFLWSSHCSFTQITTEAGIDAAGPAGETTAQEEGNFLTLINQLAVNGDWRSWAWAPEHECFFGWHLFR